MNLIRVSAAAAVMLVAVELDAWAADTVATAEVDSSQHEAFDSRGIRGSLIVCGGGKLGPSIIERFIELAGNEEARLVVIPTASARADDADENELLARWREFAPAQLTLLHTRERERADEADFVAPLREATGVWISGGSQSKLAEAYVGTAVERELHALLDRKGVIGGTSAGAAIMSRTMIASGREVPTIKKGLGFFPKAIIDQHFVVRRRNARSRKAVQDHPDHFGVGIDEAAAVELSGRNIRVLGDSTVTLMLAETEKREAREMLLEPGDRADLTALRRAALARASESFPDEAIHEPIVPSGALLIVGGGKVPDVIAERFLELAGGSSAKIVVLPTASADAAGRRRPLPSFLADQQVASIKSLPQRWPEEVRSEEFQSALREATGVWFGGGRQWRFVDAYEGTGVVELFHQVLARGGVIGGSSAGASIQAEYLVRGHPLGNQVMMAEGYERGFGFLPGVAIDQHFSQRSRYKDLEAVVARFPQLLGIGIDESTALVVKKGIATVIGENQVYFLDAANREQPHVRLDVGGSYDLQRRESARQR